MNKRVPEENTLKKYQEKRRFQETPEPKGKVNLSDHEPIFVIQKHDASKLHYDFRLEIDGVLKSWVIPKGPPLDSKTKRLAIPVEDHPLEYAYFEGIIPEGNYGAGEVMVWDIGKYKNITKSNNKLIPMHDCIANGLIKLELYGKKLKGKYALVHTNFDDHKMWLLVKIKENAQDKKLKVNDSVSALTGRTLTEIAQQKKPKQKK